MSLLNQASEFSSNTKKKRQSSIDNLNSSYDNTAFDKINTDKENTNDRIHKLIDEMDTLGQEQQVDGFENFEPIPKPELHHKKKETEIEKNVNNELNYIPETSDEKLSNYSTIYNNPPIFDKFMDNNFSNVSSNDELLEKINYMIHMLEEQQHEKTNNITEEFILYTFLGVFVIYIVDSFSRSTKYTR